MTIGGQPLDIEKLRRLWSGATERPVPDPPGLSAVAERLKTMGYHTTDDGWRCGSTLVTDLTVRSLLHLFGDVEDEIFSMIPEPGAVDRLAQIVEDT